ncbi:MAG: hypothetical protein GY953_23875, partial [bacterium]|nr:hypothetical protein [bacterium]
PDGNLLYFLSDRDGHRCIYAQPLDAKTKKPMGPPIDVAHFHQFRRSLRYGWTIDLKISVAADKLVFPLVEYTGNIWMTELGEKE